MSKKQIEEAIREYRALKADDERPALGREAYVPALAEHLAKVLPPTVDALVEVMNKLDVPADESCWLVMHRDGSGFVSRRMSLAVREWPATDNPGKAAIEVITRHTKPEPTLNEKAIEALEYLQKAYGYGGEKLETIREALEAKGCES